MLQLQPKIEPCETIRDRQGICITFWGEDYVAINEYVLTLEHELRQACVALLQDTKQCKVE